MIKKHQIYLIEASFLYKFENYHKTALVQARAHIVFPLEYLQISSDLLTDLFKNKTLAGSLMTHFLLITKFWSNQVMILRLIRGRWFLLHWLVEIWNCSFHFQNTCSILTPSKQVAFWLSLFNGCLKRWPLSKANQIIVIKI